MEFDKLVSFLNSNELFVTATKKIIKYNRVNSHTDESKSTFYIHSGEPIEIITYIDGVKETTNTCQPGDYVITEHKGEKYVVVGKKLPALYNLIEEVLITRLQPRKVAKITKHLLKKLALKDPIEFTASWGEATSLSTGDFLVKEGNGKYYKINGDVFKNTYKL